MVHGSGTGARAGRPGLRSRLAHNHPTPTHARLVARPPRATVGSAEHSRDAGAGPRALGPGASEPVRPAAQPHVQARLRAAAPAAAQLLQQPRLTPWAVPLALNWP